MKLSFLVCNKRSVKKSDKCLGPYTLEHTRPRLAHGSQASDGLVSTGEGDHSGILNVLGFHFFFFFKFSFIFFILFYFISLILDLCQSNFFCFILFHFLHDSWKKKMKNGAEKKK